MKQSDLHVFISFKTFEREAAKELKLALEQSGYKVWWQEDLQCGQEWHGKIDKAIEEAGAIVVLWSQNSVTSPWVRHEASQAMVKGIYAPVRIEIIEIDSPYNRIQATDLIKWSGEIGHPGFQNLLQRLETLLPLPMPSWKKVVNYFWRNRATALLSLFAGVAAFFIYKQNYALEQQLQQQKLLSKNVSRQYSKVSSIVDTLSGQSKVSKLQIAMQDAISQNLLGQSENLKSQAAKQESILNEIGATRQLVVSQQQKIDAEKYPLDSIDLWWNAEITRVSELQRDLILDIWIEDDITDLGLYINGFSPQIIAQKKKTSILEKWKKIDGQRYLITKHAISDLAYVRNASYSSTSDHILRTIKNNLFEDLFTSNDNVGIKDINHKMIVIKLKTTLQTAPEKHGLMLYLKHWNNNNYVNLTTEMEIARGYLIIKARISESHVSDLISEYDPNFNVLSH